MLIHSYLTDGFYEWAKLFIDSFKYHHGESYILVLTGRNLDEDQINELRSRYRNIIVENKEIDFKSLSKRTGVTKKELKNAKYEIENDRIKTRHGTLWKQFISVEDRYRNSIIDILNRFNPSYMLHMDIDTYFRGKIDELFKIIKQNDVSIRFRLDRVREDRKVLGNIIGFNNTTNKSIQFLNTWIDYIDKFYLLDKPKGYGQTSFYYAYLDMKNKIKFGDIPARFSQGSGFPNAICWRGNDGSKEGKSSIVKIFRKEFDSI